VLHRVRPLYYHHCMRILDYFGKLVGDNARFGQAVKIKVMDLGCGGLIHTADRKGWAGYFVSAAQTAHQTSSKGRFAAAQVAYKLNNFPALKRSAQALGQVFCLFG
jgi:hypothetical protein